MKRILALMLICALVVGVFAGCKKEDNTGSNAEGTSTSTTGTTAGTSEGTSTTGTAAAETGRPADHVTLKMYFHGSNVSNDKDVLEKANAYLDEKLNVTLEPIWGTWGDFDQNAVLAINGGDDIDIYFTCSWSADEYNLFARKGAWVRLDNPENNLIEKYGKDVWNLLPSVLTQGATIEGADGYGVYAVPGYKDIACQNCWDINVPLLEKYGYTVDDIKNTDYYGFGEILAKVKAGEGDDFYPLLIEGAVLERMVDNSIIVAGDSGALNMLSYYINPTDTSELGAYGNTILNKFATDEFMNYCKKTHEYYLAGYIDPAMATDAANDVRTNKQLTGQYLIGTQSYSLGYEAQASAERGFEVAMVPTTPAYVDTTSSQGAMMAISTASKNPERAMMFLNLLNTDPYLFTLLDFGIEGVHYNYNDIGEVVFDSEKRAEYSPWTNGMGNITLLPPQNGQGADFQNVFKSYYGAADEIPILGFTFNSEVVATEFAALANAAAEYFLPLCTGAVDPVEKIPELLSKLEANGMQTVVDEANKQLNDFLASKGK